MSALALILSKRGYSISGSDQKNSSNLQKLSSKGIQVFQKQSASNIEVICKSKYLYPLIVVSTAVPDENPELVAAKSKRLEICHRSDILASLIQKQPSIAVAGSHGKTTTSTFITTLLAACQEDPTAVVGGVIPYYDSNGHAGVGKLLVAEADESDGSLVKFKAQLGVITNLELDHTDHYQNLKELIDTIRIFSRNCKNLLTNYDCPTLRKNIKQSKSWSIKTTQGVDFAAIPVKVYGDKTIAAIYEKGIKIGQISLPIPGLHNLSNAIAAIAACRMTGIPFKILQRNIVHLKTPGRRFDFRGTWKGRLIVDDYAHHPSEVKATLKMARLMIHSGQSSLPRKAKRLVVIFQPHRYSRINQFLNEFAIALGETDMVLIAPIYSAGEAPIKGITNEALVRCIQKHHRTQHVISARSLDELTDLVAKHTVPDDLVLTLGAGDVNELWKRLKNQSVEAKWDATIIAA